MFFCNFVNSQCTEKLILGTFENIKYSLGCPSYKYSYDYTNNSKKLDVLNHNNIELVNETFIYIDKFIREYISKISNSYLLENLNFYSIDIVDFSSTNNFKYKVPRVVPEECKIKYSVYYYFEPIQNVKYCIGFAINEKMEILNNNNFPNGVFEPFYQTTICEIKSIASHYLGSEVEDLNLIVSENKFYWSLNEKVNYKQGENKIKNITIESSNLEKYLITEKIYYVDF